MWNSSCIYIFSTYFISTEAAERDAKGAGNQVGWTKVKPVDHVKSELVKGDLNDSEMSAYYSDDNSDDDFQPMKRTKVCTVSID